MTTLSEKLYKSEAKFDELRGKAATIINLRDEFMVEIIQLLKTIQTDLSVSEVSEEDDNKAVVLAMSISKLIEAVMNKA